MQQNWLKQPIKHYVTRSTELFTLLGIRDVSAGRDSSVGIATRYCPGIESRWGEIFRTRPDQPGAHPASYTMGTGFPFRKWGSRALTTHPYLAQRLKKEYRYTSTPPSGPP